MKKMLQSLKPKPKPILAILLHKFILRLDSYFIKFKKDYFFRQLKSHGKDCAIQWPIQVSGHQDIELGDNVSIAAFVHIWGEGGVFIGNRVLIASHTAITSLTHDYSQFYMFDTLIKGKVTIEDDVWIGAHSVIVPGVTIGRGAVIGAGSVVTKNVESFTIVAGVPARQIKIREANSSVQTL